MITIYDRYETAFTHNGFGILEVYDDVVEEELNGIFKFTFKYPYTARLADKVTVGSMLRVDTPEGAESFRIWTVKNTDGTLEVTAYHVTFDLYYQIIEDKNLVALGGQAALTRLLEDTPFTALSDVTATASARVVRKTVQQAIFSDDENSFLTRWGGEFVRDGFTLNAKNFRGRTFAQNPVAIRYGKNLVSYESEIDESTYYNRIMPVGFDGLLLPEKYVDRPGIDLNDIRVKIVEYSDIKGTEAEEIADDEMPILDAYQAMRDKAIAEFADGLYDPKVNHRVSFVDLSSTVEYENVAVLEKRYLGDEVKVINEDGIDVIARVISYKYRPNLKQYLSVELGNFQEKPMNLVAKIDLVSKTLDEYSQRQITTDQVTDILTSALGGYVKEVNGELFALDTDDPMTAQYVARWNYEGLGFSSTGVNGPYDTAIMRNGTILGEYISANSITTNQLSSDVGQNLDLSSNESITLRVQTEVTEQIDGVGIYKVDIISTGGLYFKNGVIATTLIGRVYKNNVDVTDSIDVSRFKWTKTEADGTPDTVWNDYYAGGAKQVTVTGAEISKRASFTLDILEG